MNTGKLHWSSGPTLQYAAIDEMSSPFQRQSLSKYEKVIETRIGAIEFRLGN